MQWQVAECSRAVDGDFLSQLALDGIGDVIYAGRAGSDLLVRKHAGDTGAALWRNVVDVSANGGEEQAIAVATDSSNDVVVGGRLRNEGTGLDFAVLNLNGATGDDY